MSVPTTIATLQPPSILTSPRNVLQWLPLWLSCLVCSCLAHSLESDTNLRIGIPQNYAPLSDTSSGEPTGYLVDLIAELQKQLNGDVELVSGNWPDLEKKLQTGDIDALFGLYYSEARSKTYTFGPEIFRNQVYFYLKPDFEYSSLKKAKGKRIGISGPESYILTYAKSNYPEIQWVAYNDFPEMLERIEESPDIIGWVEEEAIVKRQPDLPITYRAQPIGGPILERALRPVCMNNRPDVMQRISRALDNIDASELQRIQSRWFKQSHGTENNLNFDKEELAFIDNNPVIRFAAGPSREPISVIGSDGERRGMQQDFLKLISQRTGIEFSCQSFPDWQSAKDSLRLGLADLRGGNSLEERSTISYLNLPLVLATKKDDYMFHHLEMYADRNVSIESGNTYFEKLKSLYPRINFTEVSSDERGLELVTKGEMDGHIGNYAVCAFLVQIKFAASITIVDNLEESQNLAFVVNDDPNLAPLLSILNKAINSISYYERLAIENQWINVEVKQIKDYDSYWKAALGLALAFALASLFVWNILRLRNALVKAEERMLLANKAGAGGMFEWYPKKHKVTYSPEFFNVLGYEKNELKHSEQTLLSLTHPEDIKRIAYDQRRRILKGKEYAHKLRMQRQDGTWAWIVMRGVPTHFYKDGSVKRYIGVQMDVTVLQAAIEKQKEQEEIAHKANQSKSIFLANMSHEIRTPMNAIVGFARLLSRETTLSNQQKEFTHLIQTSSEYLLTLLDGILDLSKIEANNMGIIEQNVDLNQLLTDTAAIFRNRCLEKGLTFETNFKEDLPKRIQTDGTKLKQIIFNLLSNAVKFTQQGSIVFNVSVQDDRLHCEIIDTGYGISKQDQSRLFSAFTQGEAGINSASGTGLGLVICREFCRIMGGKINIESEIDKGSIFSFFIRFQQVDQTEENQESLPVKIPYNLTTTKRILVVDDKLSNLQYLDRFLSDQGFIIDLAQDGEEALTSWELNTPDLILLDLRMPKKDGYEVVSQIRSNTRFKQPKIVALTASAFNEQRNRILELGADKFVTKPFDEQKLIKLIAELLDLELASISSDAQDNKQENLRNQIATLTLSQTQRSRLIDACRGGYVEKIQSVIDELSETQPEAGAALNELAKNFDYEKVIRIAKQSQ